MTSQILLRPAIFFKKPSRFLRVIRNLVVLTNRDIQVPPLSKGVRGISSSGYNQIIKTISFTYPAINTVLFKIIRFILLLSFNVEIPLNPPFTKGKAII